MSEELYMNSQEIEIPDPSFSSYFAKEQNRKKVVAKEALLSSVGDDEQLQDRMNKISHQNVEQILMDGSLEYEQSTLSLDSEILEEAAMVSPEFGEEVAGRIKDVRTREQEFSELRKGFRNSLMKIEGSERLTEHEIDMITSNQVLNYVIAQQMDDDGAWGMTKDIFNLIVVPDVLYNLQQFPSRVKEEFGLGDLVQGDVTSTVQDWMSISHIRTQLSVGDRDLFDAGIMDIMEKLESNTLQRSLMLQFVQGNFNELPLEDLIGKLEAGLIAGPLLSTIYKASVRAAQGVKRLADARNEMQAMNLADRVTADIDLATATGNSQLDAANLGNPLAAVKDGIGVPTGPSAGYRHHSVQGVEKELERLDNVAQVNIVAGDPEAAVRAAAIIRKHLPEQMEIDDVEVIMKDGVATVRYKMFSEEGGDLGTFEQPYILGMVGQFTDPDVGVLGTAGRVAWSPNYIQGEDAVSLVENPQVAAQAMASIAKVLTNAAEIALKPIKGNKKSLKRVNEVLSGLDGEDVVVTADYLRNVGVRGVTLNDKEIDAYFGLRRVYDEIYELNDQALIAEANLANLRSVRVGEDIMYARVYESPEAAEAAWRTDSDSIRLLKREADGSTTELKGVSLDDLERLHNEGYILSRTKSDDPSDWFRGSAGRDGPAYRFALVKADDVGEIPKSGMLIKRPNYAMKANKDANFFVKETRMVDVGGRQLVPKEITLGYAATESQALKALAGLQKVDEGMGVSRVLKVLPDTRLDPTDTSTTNKLMGGLMRGKRSIEGIEDFNKLGGRGGRADVIEALGKAIAITAERVPMSRWRMDAQEKWFNSAKATGFPDIPANWEAARAHIANSAMGARKTKLLSAHDQISTMSSMPTQSEKLFRSAIIAAAKKFDGLDHPFFQGAATHLYSIKDHNPINLMKSATFNLTLGTFSLVQIPVQMMGALVAVSANPVYAGRAMGSWLKASALDLGRDMKVVNETAAILGKRMGDNPVQIKSFENDYAFWRASGGRESVTRGNADATAMMNGHPMDAGLLRRGFSAITQAGQTPYRMGELGNMRISFFTALEREKDLMGAAFKYDNDTMRKVIARAENYRLGMNVANKAAYQKGIWSLPTQFKQIYTKYIEALLGRNFTPTEKFRILGVQATVFGGAGIPIVNHYIDQMLVMSGISEDLSSEELRLIKTGFLGQMINGEMGIDASFAGRLTVSADLIEELKKATIEGRTPVAEIMLGASYSPLKYGTGFFNNLIAAGNLMYDTDELDINTLSASMQIVSEGLAKMPASGRKAMEAYDLHRGLVRTSDGKLLYHVLEPEKRDVLARAMGFGSQDIDEFYKTRFALMKRNEEVQARTLQVTNAWYTLAVALNTDDRDKVEHAQIALSHINTMIDSIPSQEDRSAVREGFYKRILNPQDQMEKTISEAINVFLSDAVHNANMLEPMIRAEIERRTASGQKSVREANERIRGEQ